MEHLHRLAILAFPACEQECSKRIQRFLPFLMWNHDVEWSVTKVLPCSLCWSAQLGHSHRLSCPQTMAVSSEPRRNCCPSGNGIHLPGRGSQRAPEGSKPQAPHAIRCSTILLHYSTAATPSVNARVEDRDTLLGLSPQASQQREDHSGAQTRYKQPHTTGVCAASAT